MSFTERAREPVLVLVAPEEALRCARPLPSAHDFAIEGLTAEEWHTLSAVLAERKQRMTDRGRPISTSGDTL